MLDENVTENLRKLLEEKMEMVRCDREARDKLDRQIRDHEEQVYAIRKVLGDEPSEISELKASSANQMMFFAYTKPGTITDEMRRLFEANPKITSTEVIKYIRSKYPSSRISPQSFSVWNGYFKRGRYRMDREKYRIRYDKEPPY